MEQIAHHPPITKGANFLRRFAGLPHQRVRAKGVRTRCGSGDEAPRAAMRKLYHAVPSGYVKIAIEHDHL